MTVQNLTVFRSRENTGFLGKRTPIFVHIEEQQPSLFMKHMLPSGAGWRWGRGEEGKEAQGIGRHKGSQTELEGGERLASPPRPRPL